MVRFRSLILVLDPGPWSWPLILVLDPGYWLWSLILVLDPDFSSLDPGPWFRSLILLLDPSPWFRSVTKNFVGIVDALQEEKRGEEEVKQFVKLSCQALHGEIPPCAAKMNILFLMCTLERKFSFGLWKSLKYFTKYTIIKIDDKGHFAKFFPWQDSIWEMGFVRERAVRVQRTDGLSPKFSADIISLKSISKIHVSSVFINWHHLVAKFGPNGYGAIWSPNLELMQVAPIGSQICN